MDQMKSATDLWASRDTLLGLSGLQFMQSILDGTVPPAPIAATMGFALHSVQEGRVAFRGAPGAAVTNPMGTVHGGWYGTILDSAMGCAVMTLLPAGMVYTTLEYKVNITRGIALGQEVEAFAEVQHGGRSTAVATGEIRGVADGKLYATAATTCILMTPKG